MLCQGEQACFEGVYSLGAQLKKTGEVRRIDKRKDEDARDDTL